MDRGMVSAETLTWLQATGRRYLVGTPKGTPEVGPRPDRPARLGRRAGWGGGEDVSRAGTETFVLVRSAERREKEQAIHARFSTRIEASLTRIAAP